MYTSCLCTSILSSIVILTAAASAVSGADTTRPLPSNEVKSIAGSTLHLNCFTSQNSFGQDGHVFWFKGNTRLPNNKRQEVLENGTLVLKEIEKVADDGSYLCRGSDGQEISTSRVIILVGPVITPFDFPKRTQLGNRIRLLCSVMQGDAPFRFQWLKDGKILDASPLSLGVRSDDFSMDLTFSRVTPRHNGNYTCIASNDVASVSHSAILVVDVPPMWKIEPKDTAIVGGQSVLIDCLADGVPTPVVTWERGSSSSSSSSSPSSSLSSIVSSISSPSSSSVIQLQAPRYYSVILSGSHFEVYANGSLFIKDTTEEDSGFYLCQASNTIGSGLSKVITLTVHVPPQFTSKFQSQTVRISDPVVLKCEAIGDNPMTVIWSIDKSIVIMNPGEHGYERRDEMSDKRTVSSLKIESAKRKDSKIFCCTVSNAYGTDVMNIQLIVQEPPEAPRDLKLIQSTSRTAKLAWSIPFNGNNQILKYWITCFPKDTFNETMSATTTMTGEAGQRLEFNSIENKNVLSSDSRDQLRVADMRRTSVSFSPSSMTSSSNIHVSVDFNPTNEESWTLIRGVKPATNYYCFIRAENEIGLSPASQRLEIQTDEEAPGEPPRDVKAEAIDARSARISWKAPDRSSWNGALKGYYIGYKISDSRDQYLYKTIDKQSSTSFMDHHNRGKKSSLMLQLRNSSRSSEQHRQQEQESQSSDHHSSSNTVVTLKGLKPLTEYIILVQAYNSFGAGPQSDGMLIKTTEDAAVLCLEHKNCTSTTLSLKVNSTSFTSAQIQITKTIQAVDDAVDAAVTDEFSSDNAISSSHVKAFEVHYRMFGSLSHPTTHPSSASASLSAPTSSASASSLPPSTGSASLFSDISNEWQVKPVNVIFAKNTNQSIFTLDDLTCGSSYLIYVIELETGERTESINFRTQRKAPVAPKKEQVLKIVNNTSIYIYPSSWESQTSLACPIVKLTIEYRSSSAHKWKLLSSQGISDEVIELSNLINRSVYSLRMTAHTRGSFAPTMAEYEARIGLEDPVDHSHEPYSEITKGLLTDPSTVISLASSIFVLCVGFIAVACLVTYKKRLNQKLHNSQRHKKHNRRISATSAASTMQSTILTEESAGEARRVAAGGNVVAKLNIQKTSLPPIPIDPGIRKGSGGGMHQQQQQVLRITGQSSNVSASVGKAGVAAGSSSTSSCNNMTDSKINASSSSNASIMALSSSNKKSPFRSTSHQQHDPVRGKLPNVCIPRKQLDEIENDIYNEYDEITPYATFRLHENDADGGDGDDGTATEEEFKTFTVRIGEPAYCFKGAMDGCIPLLSATSHPEYKLVSCAKAQEDSNYQCSALNNHSIASGSSNQTELIRAYEYGRRLHHHEQQDRQQQHHQQDQQRSHCHGVEIHRLPSYLNQNQAYFDDDEEEEYIMKSNASQVSESDTPTDPGIRKFTKSPPRPNETRISACFSASGTRKASARHLRNHSTREAGREDQRGADEEEEEEEEDVEKTDEDGDDDEDEDLEDEQNDVDDDDSDRALDESESESVLTASPASTCSEDERSSSSVTPTNDETGCAKTTKEAQQQHQQGRQHASDHQDAMMSSVIARDCSHRKSSSCRAQEHDHVMNHIDSHLSPHDPHLSAHDRILMQPLHPSSQSHHHQRPVHVKNHNSRKSSRNPAITSYDMQSYLKAGVCMTDSGTGVGRSDNECIDPSLSSSIQQQHQHELQLGSKVRTAVGPSSSSSSCREVDRRNNSRRSSSSNLIAASSSILLSSPSSSDAKQTTASTAASTPPAHPAPPPPSASSSCLSPSGSAGGSHLESGSSSRPLTTASRPSGAFCSHVTSSQEPERKSSPPSSRSKRPPFRTKSTVDEIEC